MTNAGAPAPHDAPVSHRAARGAVASLPGGLAQGTLILTLDGALPVEHLVPCDRVITRAGMRRVVAVEALSTRTASRRQVRVAPGALGHNRPDRALILAADTPVFVRDWRAQALCGAAQGCVPAERLIDGEFVTECDAPTRLFRLIFDSDQVIYADGVEIGCLIETADTLAA
ncbi:Hint domain-containing protein [Phaeovulum vinaykumarii]|nr:Hint domain-containing protein [Phaeovulum vinaykumarii]